MQMIFKDTHPIRPDCELRAFECMDCRGPVLTKSVSKGPQNMHSSEKDPKNHLRKPEVQDALEKAEQYRNLAAAAGTPEERDHYLVMTRKWVAIANGWKQIADVTRSKRADSVG